MKKRLLHHLNKILRQILTLKILEKERRRVESRGRGGESVKAGPITEHLAHTSGLQRKHIFHDTFNLIFQLIENIHQLLPSDSIYCVHELALTGPAGSLL